MTRQPLDFVPELRIALVQGYAIIAGKLNAIAKANGLTLIDAPIPEMDFHQSQTLFAACLPAIRTIALIPANDVEICPWTLGYINHRNNRPWNIPLHSDIGIDGVIEFMASWDKQRFDLWDQDIVEPVKAYHQEWLDWIDRVEQPSVAEICSKISPEGRESRVLIAMLELNATEPVGRLSQQRILNEAYDGDANDNRRVFTMLEKLHLITKGKNGRGYYLTALGISVAKKMSAL